MPCVPIHQLHDQRLLSLQQHSLPGMRQLLERNHVPDVSLHYFQQRSMRCLRFLHSRSNLPVCCLLWLHQLRLLDLRRVRCFPLPGFSLLSVLQHRVPVLDHMRSQHLPDYCSSDSLHQRQWRLHSDLCQRSFMRRYHHLPGWPIPSSCRHCHQQRRLHSLYRVRFQPVPSSCSHIHI